MLTVYVISLMDATLCRTVSVSASGLQVK